MPAGVMAQLLLAGLSLFQDSSLWIAHSVLGFGLVIPIGAVTAMSFLRRARWGHLRGRASLLSLAYLAQVMLILAAEATGSGLIQALHVANAGLVLAAALSLARLTSPSPPQLA